jgi:hypothetical protein
MGMEIHPELLLLLRRQLLDGVGNMLIGECNVRHGMCSLVCVRIMPQGAFLGCLQPCAGLGAQPHAFETIAMGQRGAAAPRVLSVACLWSMTAVDEALCMICWLYWSCMGVSNAQSARCCLRRRPREHPSFQT